MSVFKSEEDSLSAGSLIVERDDLSLWRGFRHRWGRFNPPAKRLHFVGGHLLCPGVQLISRGKGCQSYLCLFSYQAQRQMKKLTPLTSEESWTGSWSQKPAEWGWEDRNCPVALGLRTLNALLHHWLYPIRWGSYCSPHAPRVCVGLPKLPQGLYKWQDSVCECMPLHPLHGRHFYCLKCLTLLKSFGSKKPVWEIWTF